MTPNVRVLDLAKGILESSPLLTEQKADVWERFHAARSSEDLGAKLAGIDVSAHVKAALLDVKKLIEPEAPTPTALEIAIHRLAQIDRRTLDLVEQYPNVLRHLLVHVK